MIKIKMHISNVKLPFYPLCEIKCGLQNRVLIATLAMSSAQDLPRVVLVEDLYTHTSAYHGIPRIHQIKLGPSWMDSILLFLEKDVLPEEKSETDKVRRKAPRF